MPLRLRIRPQTRVTLTPAVHVEGEALSGALSGSILSTSSVSGELTRRRRLIGGIDSISQVSGTLRLGRALSGSIDSASAVSAELTRLRRLDGAIESLSSVTGQLTRARRLEGDISSQSSVSGYLTRLRSLQGDISSTSSVSGTLTLDTPGYPYLLHETFTGTNGDNVSSRAMDSGDMWTAVRGAIILQSGKGRATNTTDTLYVADAGESEHVQIVTLNLGGQDYGVGLLMRYQDANNFWFTYMISGGMRLYECNAGAFSIRASNAYAYGITTDRTITVTTDAGSILIESDGANVGYSSTFLNTNTKVGFYSDYANSGQKWDDYTCEALP